MRWSARHRAGRHEPGESRPARQVLTPPRPRCGPAEPGGGSAPPGGGGCLGVPGVVGPVRAGIVAEAARDAGAVAAAEAGVDAHLGGQADRQVGVRARGAARKGMASFVRRRPRGLGFKRVGWKAQTVGCADCTAGKVPPIFRSRNIAIPKRQREDHV